MRALIVHNFYRTPGGEDSIVQEELSMLSRNGVDVELFAADNHDIRGKIGRIATALHVIYNPRARDALSKKLTEFLPDVVHIHNFFPLLSPSILDACITAGVPSVITLHNFRLLSPGAFLHPRETINAQSVRKSCWWAVPKRVYRDSAAATLAVAAMIEFHKRAGTWTRKVGRFIALSEWAKQMFVEGGLPAERIVVKPNCVARPAAFDCPRRDRGLFVGRLDEQKGIRTLLRAWKEIDYPLTIMGDGPLADLVKQNTTDRITYLGRQPREVVQREMQSSKFLLLPSMHLEMFPVTILEAFSNHLPVICSDLPSLEGLVTPRVSGLKFSPGDADALAAQVRWAISNAVALDEMGRRAHALYLSRYTPESNYNQLIRIYAAAMRVNNSRHSDDLAPAGEFPGKPSANQGWQ